MYNKKKILALIPARGGSKGIKNKNIINLHGKPMITYTIEAANNSSYIDYVLVSTDSPKIANVAKTYGANVPFLRPVSLASDASTTLDVVLHAIDYITKNEGEYAALILLQPTSPLRTSDDIDKAIEFFFENNQKSLASVSEVDDNPLLIRTLNNDGRLVPLLNTSSTCRRQDMPVFYRVNGSIYINNINEINTSTSFNDNQLAFVMDKEHAVDIDELKDVYMAEYYLMSH